MAARRKVGRSTNTDRAMHSPRDYQNCATRLKALADPERLKIVTSLLRGEKSVSSLADELNLPIDNVSHHLRVLRAAHSCKPNDGGSSSSTRSPRTSSPTTSIRTRAKRSTSAVASSTSCRSICPQTIRAGEQQADDGRVFDSDYRKQKNLWQKNGFGGQLTPCGPLD